MHSNSNEKIPASHKFQYLLDALSNEARDVVSEFNVFADDYPKARKALTDLYNDKNNFSSLETIAKENPDRLRELTKSTAGCLKSLESVGVGKMQVGSVITYSLICKLPPLHIGSKRVTERSHRHLMTFAHALRREFEWRPPSPTFAAVHSHRMDRHRQMTADQQQQINNKIINQINISQ